MFEYKFGNKINYNSISREARRIEICFFFLFQKTVQQGIWKKAISLSSHPKLAPFILLVWLCWAGGGNNVTGGWLSINRTDPGWPTDSGLTLAAPPMVND